MQSALLAKASVRAAIEEFAGWLEKAGLLGDAVDAKKVPAPAALPAGAAAGAPEEFPEELASPTGDEPAPPADDEPAATEDEPIPELDDHDALDEEPKM